MSSTTSTAHPRLFHVKSPSATLLTLNGGGRELITVTHREVRAFREFREIREIKEVSVINNLLTL